MAPRARLGVGGSVVAVVVVLAVLASCGGADDDSPGVPAGGRPATVADLEGRSFVLTRVVEDGQEHALVGRYEIPLTFGEGGFHVYDDCIDIISTYSLDREGELTLHDPHGPRAGCTGAQEGQAVRLSTVVANGATVTIDGDALTFSKGDVAATFSQR